MIRVSDRSFFIVLCVVTLSVVVSSVLLKRGQHRADEQNWSLRQRASVATGAVRGQVPAAASATPADSPAMPPTMDAESKATDVYEDSNSKSVADSTVQNEVAQPSKPAVPRTSHRPSRSIKEKATRHTQVVDNRSTEVVAPPRAEVPPSEPAPADLRASADTEKENPTPSAPRPSQPGQQADATVTNASSAAPAPPAAIAAPHAKTRQEVQDELRKARMNGALPRFGNPDPYGPGGSPSTSND